MSEKLGALRYILLKYEFISLHYKKDLIQVLTVIDIGRIFGVFVF